MATTLYLNGIVSLLSNCKYKSVYVGLLSTEVWRVPCSLDVIRIPKTGMVPSVMEIYTWVGGVQVFMEAVVVSFS